ncbi:MAG: sensor histidine kinase [Ktedonobacteraceae bacterium]|nr:sensor histidine kinase [Ktedonobacteraceae bacterium]
MHSNGKAEERTPYHQVPHPVKRWSGLRIRMALSYVGTTVATALLLELLLVVILFITLTRFSILDQISLNAIKHAAELYALQTTVQGGGVALNPATTFEPGHPASLIPSGSASSGDTQIIGIEALTSEHIASIDVRAPLPRAAAFALLIAPNGQVVASSYPARYPPAVAVTHLLPEQMPLIRAALAGTAGSKVEDRSQGKWLVAVQPVLNRDRLPIGVIYIQKPQLVSDTEIAQSLLKGWFRSGPGLLLLLVPIGLFFGMITTRGVIQRLHRLMEVTAYVASGDYTQRVPIVKQDELGQLEAQLNTMAQQLFKSTERQRVLTEQNARLEERHRLARDLHDSVKQQIFAISMQLGAALSMQQHDPEGALQHVQEADTLSYQVRQELTNLIHELRPIALQGKKLPAALKDLVADWSRQYAIVAEVQIADPRPLSAAVEEAFVRVVQEALSNIARHSQATRIMIALTNTGGQAQLSIVDNGQGFDTTATDGYGVGLHSMQERIEELGGTLTVQSRVGEGTRIVACCASQSVQNGATFLRPQPERK